MKTTTSGRHPTTAEWLAKRDGVIAVAHFARGLVFQRSWGPDVWAVPMDRAMGLAHITNAVTLLVRINDDAQTIRVLVDGDDGLVVVHAHDCGYHRSMRRGMQMALRGLKAERERMERMAYGDVSCSEMGLMDDEDDEHMVDPQGRSFT